MWDRVPSSPGQAARSWAAVAKGAYSQPIVENVRWEGGCVGRVLIQQDSSHPLGGVFHGRGNPTNVAMALVPTAKSTSVVLLEEADGQVLVIYTNGSQFIGNPCGGLCSDLPTYARLFHYDFLKRGRQKQSPWRRQWCWEGKHVLMLKPWHPTFNPDSESLDQMPLWIRLLNLPMQYWLDSYFEAVENFLGTFLMADEDSLNMLHTTFYRLLVVVDVTMGLPSEISITSSKGSWLQSIVYEGIPFRCRRCFKTTHIVDSCPRLRVKCSTSWWKEVTPQFYTVDKVVGDLSSPTPK
ncbi:hypothetical protein SUGI_1201090 [Cryptomeria japonica]|nr:hypothetical protein SUGI_1201090 [Cryptomeria japonica]